MKQCSCRTHIVRGEIARIVPDGIVMADETPVALDVLSMPPASRRMPICAQ